MPGIMFHKVYGPVWDKALKAKVNKLLTLAID